MLKFKWHGTPSATQRLLGPISRVNAAAFDDGPYRAQQQNPSAMIRHDHLFRGCNIAPLLVATGRAGKHESVTAENHNHLISGQARRSPVTQLLPRPVLRPAATRFPSERDTVESLPRCHVSLLLLTPRPRCTPEVQGRPQRSSWLARHTPGPHGISCPQYIAEPTEPPLRKFRL